MSTRGTLERMYGAGIGSGYVSVSWGILGFIAIVCVALLGLETSHIVSHRAEVMAGSRKDTANLTSSLIQHAELTFRTADALLIGLVDRLENAGELDPKGRQRLKDWFLLEVNNSTEFLSFGVIDSNGSMTISSVGDNRSNYAGRDYFIYHQTHEDRQLLIGRTVKGRNAGEWLIPVTRRFNRADGTFGGVAVAAINPKYFQDFYDRLELGNNGAVLLASLNGTVLVRRPFAEANVGKDISQGGIFQLLKHSRVGSAEITASTDGVNRLNSYEQGQTYPLVVAVAQNVEELLSPWRQTAIRQLTEVAAIVGFISLMGALVWRMTKTLATNAGRLHETNARFDAALGNMSQGLSMFDERQQLVIWNDRYADLYRVPPELLKVGTPYEVIVADRVTRGVLKEETSELAVKARVSELTNVPVNSRRIDQLADGRFVRLTRQPMEGGGWVAIVEDITEQRRAEAEIVHLARHDVLTGLANRAEFNAKLEEASKRLNRNGVVTVMMLDLDHFKAVNDTLGHPAGDRLLVEVARRLKASVRETDVLARLGGDEFAIIQEGNPDQHEGAIALALRVLNALAEPFDLDGHAASIGTSIGIVFAPEHGNEPDELLKKADLALYNVKADGKNDFRAFQPEMLEAAHTQLSAESELRDAIARHQFELHYQPVVDAKTRLLCGAEALVRWRHPARGLVPPDQFIPLAESTGLIVPLGEWILQQACRDAVAWPQHIKIAINISAVQFKKGNLFDIILCTLVETGLAPERLELEITETVLLESQDSHLATIRQLKNLGISMALDDFGTGYSSASYLTKFPFDKIKIDKSFTQGVLDRRDCAAVVSSVLALAQGLGTVTTAEGIETEQQLEYMRNAGVDLAQGYLFGRPLPISEFGRQIVAGLKELVA